MVVGLRINQDGTKETFNYTDEDAENCFDRFIDNRGVGNIDYFHIVVGEDELTYIFLGWEIGYSNFNQYEFHTNNVFGDALIIAMDINQEPMDINEDVIDGFFSTEDLDDFIIGDEIELGGNVYDFTDGFLVDDEDDDYLDFIDYEDDPNLI